MRLFGHRGSLSFYKTRVHRLVYDVQLFRPSQEFQIMSPESTSQPFLPHMERLRHEFERWLEAAWSQGGRAMDAIGLRGRHYQPAIDLTENLDSVEIAFDLPGIECSQIELTQSGQSLTLSGCLPKDEPVPGSRIRLSERPRGEFSRTVILPPGLDAGSISAVGKNGVIRVRIQKLEAEKPRQISIRTE